MPKNPLISTLPVKTPSQADLKKLLTSQAIGDAAEYATHFTQKANYDKALANEAAQKAQQQIDLSRDIASLYAAKSHVDSLAKLPEYKTAGPLAGPIGNWVGEVFANKIKFNPNQAVKPEHSYTASLTKDVLDSGFGKTEPALSELKKIVDGIDGGVDLDEDTKTDLVNKYKNISSYYQNKLRQDAANRQLDNFFKTNTPAQIQEVLKKNAYTKTNTPESLITDLGGDYNAIQNQLLNLDSYRPGSPVYNENDLQLFKGLSSFKPSKDYDLGATKQYSRYRADLTSQYNNALLQALGERQKANYLETTKLDTELEKLDGQTTPEALEKKSALNAKRAELTQQDATLRQIGETIQPYTDSYKFLKKYDPIAAESVKRDDAREVYANQNLNKGWMSNLFTEHLQREAEGVASNVLKQVSGLSSIFGLKGPAAMLNLGGDYYAPPQYRKGTDLDNNGRLEGKEIDLDGNGTPAYITDLHWKDPKTGKGHWNLWSGVEQAVPIAVDIATTLLLTRGAGGTAKALGTTWSNIAKVSRLEAGATKLFLESVTPRISTMGGTMATVFPRMYAEERRNFKDDRSAFDVAMWRSVVEGLTESIVPETRLFAGSTKFGPLDDIFSKISSKIDPTDINRLTRATDLALGLLPANSIKPAKMAMLLAPMRIRKTISGALQETIEEEASLLGNYLVDKYAANQNADIEKTNELTAENFLNTAVEGFIPSLFISGAALAQKEHKIDRINASRWDIANNPATYTALVDQQINKGKITPEEGLRRKVAIKQLSDRLDVIPELKHIKSLTTLLDDKDAQRDFFLNTLFHEDLLKVDTTKLTPDEIKEYENTLDQTQTKLQATKALAEKYANLTEAEKRNIVANVFDKQAKELEKPEATLGNLIYNGNYSLDQLKDFNPDDDRYDFLTEQHLQYKDRVDTALNNKVDSLINTFENNPEQITGLEALHIYHTLAPALVEYEKMHTAIPFAPVFGPKGKFGHLQNLAELEVNTREYTTEEQIAKEIHQNLNNPEVKNLQNIQLGVTELSDEEIAKGELTEGAHEHLTDGQRLMLGRILEEHAAQKEENPNQTTELEDQRAYGLSVFKNIIEGLTPEEAVAKIKEVNQLGINYQPSTTTTVVPENKPLEKNNQTTNQPTNKPTQNTNYVEPTSDVESVLEYLGLDPENTLPLNLEIFTDVDAQNTLIDQIEEPQDKAEEKLALFEKVLAQDNPLDIYSGLLAMYSEQAKNLEQFFATYEDSPNTDLLPFLVKSQITQLRQVLDQKLKPQTDSSQTPNPEKGAKQLARAFEELEQAIADGDFVAQLNAVNKIELNVAKGAVIDQDRLSKVQRVKDTALANGYEMSNLLGKSFDPGMKLTVEQSIPDENLPEGVEVITNVISPQINKHDKMIQSARVVVTVGTKASETPTPTFEDDVVDSIIQEQELLNQVQSVPNVPRDLALNIVSLDSHNVPMSDDPRTAFAVNVVNAFDNLREKLPAVKLRIQGAMETYRYVLSSAKFEALKELKNKPTLTPEDVAQLKSILSLNGVPFHETSIFQYLADNPSKIGSGVLSVLTDAEGNVMLFEKNGVPSPIGTPLISTFNQKVLSGSLKNVVAQIKANPETVATANITGTIPGTDLVDISLNTVKNKPNYSIEVVNSVEPKVKVGYTLYPGRTYMINSNNFFKPATVINLPKADGELVFKLVEGFNNGTLPKDLPTSTAEFLDYLRTYQLTSFKSDKAVYILDKNKAGDKIVFKKKNIKGKWQTATNLTEKVKSDIIASFNDAYKNIVASRLESNSKYYPVKLNSKGEIELLPATTYKDHVMSKEFGATFREEGNRTLGFDAPIINAPSSTNVTVSEVVENIPSQETPITEAENIPTPVPTVQETSTIERRRQEGTNSRGTTYKGETTEKGGLKITKYTEFTSDGKRISKGGRIMTPADFIKEYNIVDQDYLDSLEGATEIRIYEVRVGKDTTGISIQGSFPEGNIEMDVAGATLASLETPQENKAEEKPIKKRRTLDQLNQAIQADTTSKGELTRSRLLSNKINAKQKAKAKAWVENHPIFRNTPFIFDQTINHPEAYAVWSKAGIQLFNGANYAEAYHEAWHEFTQLYLTPEQKDALYKDAAKIYGDLTPLELEERLAEDFRTFALGNGKTMPEAIQKAKQAKGIFQAIWDFITNLFSNKKAVDFYFKQLYKGNIATYKRSEDNIRFKELFSKKLSIVSNEELLTYSFVESDKIVKQFDALFTHVANQIYKNVNGSFVNVSVSKNAIPKVYSGVKSVIAQTYKELLELEEAGDTSVTPKLDYLDNVLENFDTVVQFHIQNSLIFDNKIKRGLQLENLEEQQDQQGELGNYELSVNEISQKELASNLIISAIRTLPKHTKGNLEPETDYLFGVPQLGDFDTNWNILRRTLAGLTTYEQMYDRLTELAKDYPQFKTLISYLPSAIERFSALSFKNEFFNLFTMPYMEGYTTKIEKNEKGAVTEVKVQKSSSLDAVRLKNLYDGEFGMTQGLYKVMNPNTGLQEFDVDAYFAANPTIVALGGPLATKDEQRQIIGNLINLIRPLGFNLSNEAVDSIPLENAALVQQYVQLIRTKLKSLGENGTVANPLNQLSSPHKVDKQVIKSENSAVNYFLNLEVKANPEYIDDMRMNAEGSRIWSVNQHTFMSRVASALNDYETYPTAQDVYKAFPQLNPEYNSNTISSFVLDYLFDKDGNRKTDSVLGGKPTYRQVELSNLEGIKIEEEGKKTINTNYIDKHFAEVNSFLQQGVEEINRLSGKSTTRSFVLSLGLRKFLGMDKEWSRDTNGNIRLFEPQMRLLFKALIAEIKMTKEIEDKIANGQKVYTRDGKPKKQDKEREEEENLKRNFIRDKEGNPKLAFFEDILTSEQRKKLYFLFENTQVINENGDNVLDELFEKATQEFPIIVEIAQNFNQYFLEQAKVSDKYFKSRNLNTVSEVDLFKYHFFSFLSRLEQHKLFYGHPYYYKGPKDIEKRLSAWNAFGSYTMLDAANTAFLQDRVFTQRGSFVNYAEANNIPVNPQVNDLSKVNYIVLKDNPVVSKTALANEEAYGNSLNAYTNDKGTKTQDAAAFMTLDFFKRFYALSTGVTPEMEEEIGRQNRIYQAILDNDKETLNKELNTKPSYKFTIKKLQYAGFATGVNKEGIPVFHKYSVKPILPSEAANSPELLAILHKLHASSADYAVFESGTKIAETVEPVKLFTKDGKVDTTNVPIGQIDIKHLKEQVLVENKESFETVFSTQFRSLLYKDAEDSEVLKLYEAYKSYVKEIVEYDKLNYLENLQDKDKLVNFLLKELEKKNASEATKDLIKVKNDGSLMYMLDSMVDRTVMESAIVSSAKRKIIRQKLNGAQRVQYPVSVIRPGKTLNYYSLTKDGKQINQAEVIVSFSKGYYPLLNLIYEGSPIGELDVNGVPTRPYDALTRLNEALKNPAFVKANKKALSMVAIRIPGQGYNSMENFTVVEFLPEESGEIILVPDEMVVKSGSDYDIDKLFCYDPYIAPDGSVPLTTQTAQQSFDRKKKLEEEYKGYTTAINETREYKNELIATLQEILVRNGLDKNSKLGAIYKELKELKSSNSSEVDEEAISVEDLKRLQEAFKSGTSLPIVKKSQELINKIKALSNVLSESFDQKISQELGEVVDTLKELYSEKQKVKNEIEGLRKTLANNLVFNIVDRLSQSDIFESLITPNSSDIIKDLAKRFGTIEDNTTATYTSILSPIYQLYVFNLNTYKKSLGVGAKMNTFHSLVQKANLVLENASANRFYILPSNKVEDKVSYSQIYDTNGDVISLLNGQMISAHVDIEKEDEVARIYFNNTITPVVLYTAIAGTPVEDITRLINKGYKTNPEDEEFKKSSIIRYGLGTPAETILTEYLQDPDISKFIKIGKKGIILKRTVDHALNLLTSKASNEVNTEYLLNAETPLADFYRFMQFLEFEAQQKQLSTLSLNTDYHTFSPQNFESFRRGGEDLRQLRKENYFNKSGVDYIISQTEIAPFQIQSDILDKFVEVMPISANRKLTDIILTLHASNNKKGAKVDYEKFSRTFKNDLLYALFINRVPEAQEYEQYLIKTNEDNVVNMHTSLASRLEKRGISSNNVIFDMFKQNTNNESSYIRTGLLLSSVDYSINVYKEAFEDGLSWTSPELSPESEEDAQLIEDMQKFFKVFAYAGILGTQLNKKIDSYLPLIPESIYTYAMSQIVNDFRNELETVSSNLLEEVRSTISAKTTEEEDLEDELTTKLLSETNFLSKFINRFQAVHPEFNKIFKDVNPDLAFFKDYRLDQENTTPTKRKVVEENVSTFATEPISINGVEISSNAKGLAAALTNPTELAKRKGNLTQSYPIEFRGKTYSDAEAAYQALKNTATKDEGPNSTYNLMVDILKAKLEQYPRLLEGIKNQGGSEWVLKSTHQPTKQNSVWETGGKNWFIKALNEAYLSIETTNTVSSESSDSVSSILADPFKTVEEINRNNNC